MTTHPQLFPASMMLPDPTVAGARLERLDAFNWGTFDGRIWTLHAGGHSTLLTGQIGAGKSSLIDAVTALVVNANRVVFNKAAGADKDERDLRTYALGACGKYLDPYTGEEQKRYLRKTSGAPSVIQAVFRLDDGSYLTAGLILTFTASDSTRPTRTNYLVPKAQSIAELLGTATDLKTIRAAVVRDGGDTWRDNFSGYQKSLCKGLGTTPGALALFAHTVSMKEVSNLTAFVRHHMLEPESVTERIDAMLTHYADCSRAHDVVVDVRRQIEYLDKVEQHARLLDTALGRIQAAEEAERALPNQVQRHRQQLLIAAIDSEQTRKPQLESQIEQLKRGRESVNGQIALVQRSIDGKGGAQLREAQIALDNAEGELVTTRNAASRLQQLARQAELDCPDSASLFNPFRTAAQEIIDAAAAVRQDGLDQYSDVDQQIKQLTTQIEGIDADLQQARSRLSNIDVKSQRVRDALCAHLHLAHEHLPFVGELLQVRPGEHLWEGAIERVVHAFGVSLLVPEEHIGDVDRWVNERNLQMLLNYYPVPTGAAAVAQRRPAPAGSTIAGKLDVRPSTPFTNWLHGEVSRRYTHECVEEVADLKRHAKAITAGGLLRESGRRVKDDRRDIRDRLTYVLGWDTAARVKALHERKSALTEQRAAHELTRSQLISASSSHQSKLTAASQIISGYPQYATIDTVSALSRRDQQQQLLETLSSNPQLKELTTALADNKARHTELESELSELQQELGAVISNLTEHQNDLAAITVVDDNLLLGADGRAALDKAIAAAAGAPAQLRDCERWATKVRDALQTERSSADSTRERHHARLIGAIKDLAGEWPLLVAEIDTTNAASRRELIAMRARLIGDDLPAHEQRFRELLQQHTINGIAAFHRALATAADTIRARIAVINTALVGIDYTDTTYVSIEVEPTKEPSIAAFRAEMREITENRILGDAEDAYSEERFLKVRSLLDRIRGRDGSANEDKRWVERVTDVRNWFTYGAVERRRGSDETGEYYSDSDGKSGGQKEKLAYTMLAASLAYQYGLADNRDDTFRLVMIDEAFGRGSEQSAQFGMRLFQQLGLQVLVATPLGKIRTIERYVRSVAFVEQDEETKKSRIASMPLEVWQTKRSNALHAAQQAAQSAETADGTRADPATSTSTGTGSGEGPVSILPSQPQATTHPTTDCDIDSPPGSPADSDADTQAGARADRAVIRAG